MSLLVEKLRKTVPAYRDAIKDFGKTHGEKDISKVSVGALLGGQRGVLGMLCDTSIVPPDLLDTIKRVCSRSRVLSRSRIELGTVVSRTLRSRYPFLEPKHELNTSEVRLLPPIPRSTARVNPDNLISSAKSLRRCFSPTIVSTI
jgi:hypothetical protein